MADEVFDFAMAAGRAGLSIADLEALVASGAIDALDERVASHVIVPWIERDRESRRRALVALAAGIGAEVFY